MSNIVWMYHVIFENGLQAWENGVGKNEVKWEKEAHPKEYKPLHVYISPWSEFASWFVVHMCGRQKGGEEEIALMLIVM